MRYNNLTAARFVAAFLVYLHHTTSLDDLTGHPTFWTQFFLNGYVGVSFFFVLSGFVIAASSLEKLGQPSVGGIATFYWHRIARIVPLWAVVSSPLAWYAYTQGDPALPWFLTFTQAWSRDLDIAFSVLAVAWTLSVEMFFYAIFPLIAAVVSRIHERVSGPLLVTLGLGIGVAGAAYFVAHPQQARLEWPDPNGSHYWLYQLPLSRCGEFIAGIGIFVLLRSGRLDWARKPSMIVLAGAVAVLFGVMGNLPIGGAWWTVPYAPLFAVIVAMLARLDRLGWSVTWPVPILLGEASFAFYLVHQYYGVRRLLPALSSLGPVAAQCATFVIVLSTSVGLFILIESPARKWLVHLFRKQQPTPRIEREHAAATGPDRAVV